MALLSRRDLMVLTGAFVVVRPSWAAAVEHEVLMLNKDPDNKKNRMIFQPNIIVLNAGDQVTFVSKDKGHNSASIKDMIPEGAEPWKSKIGKDFSVTLDVPGFYGYQCTPHYSLGMVGLIVVNGDGKLANLEQSRSVKHRGRAKKKFEEIWAKAEERGLLS